MSAIVDQIAESIARMEGFYKAGTLAARNNNPGNLRTWGSNPVVNGYAQFPTADAGWSALKRQVQLLIDRGLTLKEFFGGKPGVYPGYAPAADANDPNGYAAFVAKRLGVDINTPLKALASTFQSPRGRSSQASRKES